MSQTKVKTIYNTIGERKEVEQNALYCLHDHAEGTMTYYNNKYEVLVMHFEGNGNGLWDAVNRLRSPFKEHWDGELREGVERFSYVGEPFSDIHIFLHGHPRTIRLMDIIENTDHAFQANYRGFRIDVHAIHTREWQLTVYCENEMLVDQCHPYEDGQKATRHLPECIDAITTYHAQKLIAEQKNNWHGG